MGKLASTAKSKIKDKINFDFKLLISFMQKKKRILSLPSFIDLYKIWTFKSTGFSTVCHMCEVKSK